MTKKQIENRYIGEGLWAPEAKIISGGDVQRSADPIHCLCPK